VSPARRWEIERAYKDAIDDAKAALKAARRELALCDGDDTEAHADVAAAELELERLYDLEPDGEPAFY